MIQARYIGNDAKAVTLLGLARVALDAAQDRSQSFIKSTRQNLTSKIKGLRKRVRNSTVARLEKRSFIEMAEKLADLERNRQKIIQNAHQECLELVLAIASEVIAEKITLQPETIIKRIERGLNGLISNRNTKLFINPADAQAIESLSMERGMQIVFDETLVPGDATIETPSGVMRLKWREHFKAIAEKLLSTLNQNQIGG